MATPVLGPQADGTNLWKVQVGGMDMEAGIDMHAFFPAEITVNAGDSVFWHSRRWACQDSTPSHSRPAPRIPPDLRARYRRGTPVASPEGPPRLLINPVIAFPDGRTEYDGTGT